jgi:hypothetical protein
MTEIIQLKLDNKFIIPGKFINDIGGYTIYDRNIDCYHGDELVCRFRKNILTNEENITDFAVNIRSCAIRKKENRGDASGAIDRDKVRTSAKDLFDIKGSRAGFYTLSGKKSNTKICNQAKSNVIGYIDVAKRNTNNTDKVNIAQYCRDYPMKYEKCIPFLEDINTIFKNQSVDQYQYQKIRNNPEYIIGKTVFSTVTVNYSWQSAVHKDSNNGSDTMAVISVVKDVCNDNNYSGGYLLFPEFNIGFNILETDIFIGNTQKYYHCNSPLIPIKKDISSKWSPDCILNKWYLNRISIVAYLKKSCSILC